MNVKNLLLPLLPLMAACSGRQTQPHTPMRVETIEATSIDLSPTQEFPFIAQPLHTSVLSFRVSGPVDRFEVYAGNHYERGQLIAGIDPRDFQLRHEQAEAVYRQARADYERIAALYEKDNLPASSYEAARAAWISAQTARDTALNELNDTQLRAPFDGYVGEVFIERYQDVKASQPVVTLTDISSLRIEIYVTQEIAMQAGKLDSVELSFDHCPDRIFRAKVVECARSTTSNNLSYLLTARLPNPDAALPAGLSGRVRFELPGAARRSVAIPQKALCHRPGTGSYVWTVDETGQVSRREVAFGELLPGSRVAVTRGVAPGERIAVSGLRFLEEGMTVDPTAADVPSAAPHES